MTDTRSPKPRTPERLCVACRALKPRTELVRLVRLPDESIALDLDTQLHGRGAYVCKARACIERACKARSFNKALRRNIPEQLLDALSALGHEMS